MSKKVKSRKPKSDILGAVHETARDLHEAGTFDDMTMREFDALCLAPVKPLSAEEIREIRSANHVSQPVFAAYLNVSKTAVANWENGENKPGPTALKLLNIVKNKGLEAVA